MAGAEDLAISGAEAPAEADAAATQHSNEPHDPTTKIALPTSGIAYKRRGTPLLPWNKIYITLGSSLETPLMLEQLVTYYARYCKKTGTREDGAQVVVVGGATTDSPRKDSKVVEAEGEEPARQEAGDQPAGVTATAEQHAEAAPPKPTEEPAPVSKTLPHVHLENIALACTRPQGLLFWSKSPSTANTPLGIVNLARATTINALPSSSVSSPTTVTTSAKPHALEICTPGRRIVLSLPSATAHASWLTALTQVREENKDLPTSAEAQALFDELLGGKMATVLKEHQHRRRGEKASSSKRAATAMTGTETDFETDEKPDDDGAPSEPTRKEPDIGFKSRMSRLFRKGVDAALTTTAMTTTTAVPVSEASTTAEAEGARGTGAQCGDGTTSPTSAASPDGQAAHATPAAAETGEAENEAGRPKTSDKKTKRASRLEKFFRRRTISLPSPSSAPAPVDAPEDSDGKPEQEQPADSPDIPEEPEDRGADAPMSPPTMSEKRNIFTTLMRGLTVSGGRHQAPTAAAGAEQPAKQLGSPAAAAATTSLHSSSEDRTAAQGREDVGEEKDVQAAEGKKGLLHFFKHGKQQPSLAGEVAAAATDAAASDVGQVCRTAVEAVTKEAEETTEDAKVAEAAGGVPADTVRRGAGFLASLRLKSKQAAATATSSGVAAEKDAPTSPVSEYASAQQGPPEHAAAAPVTSVSAPSSPRRTLAGFLFGNKKEDDRDDRDREPTEASVAASGVEGRPEERNEEEVAEELEKPAAPVAGTFGRSVMKKLLTWKRQESATEGSAVVTEVVEEAKEAANAAETRAKSGVLSRFGVFRRRPEEIVAAEAKATAEEVDVKKCEDKVGEAVGDEEVVSAAGKNVGEVAKEVGVQVEEMVTKEASTSADEVQKVAKEQQAL